MGAGFVMMRPAEVYQMFPTFADFLISGPPPQEFVTAIKLPLETLSSCGKTTVSGSSINIDQVQCVYKAYTQMPVFDMCTGVMCAGQAESLYYNIL